MNTRRQFLTHAAIAAGGLFCTTRLAFAGAAPAGGGRRPRLVLIVMRGALDGLAAVPPYGDRDYASLRGEAALRAPGTPGGALALDGFQERSAEKAIEAIETSKRQPFGRVLFALGIPHVGSVTAQALADGFGSMEALRSAGAEEIAGVEGVGPVIAEQVAGRFGVRLHRRTVERVRRQ